MQLSGGDILLKALAEEGVEYLFGYPGGAALHIYDAIYRQDKVKHILVRHEQGATHMADGYARATGKAGAVLVTSGPGATNTITGIATAFMDSIPMVIISGQVASSLIGSDAFQEIDMLGVSRPVVKHNFSIKHPKDIAATIKKAFHIATTGCPGPVVVDIPKDMTDPGFLVEYDYDFSVSMRTYRPVKRGHPGQIKRAFAAICKSSRPVVYAGGGVITSGATEVFRTFLSRTGFYSTNTLMGLGATAGSDPSFLGMLGMHGTFEANMSMHHADLVIAVGARFDDRVTNEIAHFCPDATIIHIDINPANVGKTVNPHIPIVGPATQVLESLNALLEETPIDADKLTSWHKQIAKWRSKQCLAYTERPDQLLPQQVVATLYEKTRHTKHIITSDVGQHQMFAALYYKYDWPRQWINSGGLGTMGFGFPAAVGAALAYPDTQVVCITGEGSIQMCLQELSTCSQYDITNIKIININNQSLGMVKQWQDMQYEGRHAHSYMTSIPNFVLLAEAYGHIGLRVEKPEQLEPALDQAFTTYRDKLVFIDILVDPHEHVYPMQIKGGAMRDMWLSKTERT